MMGRSFSLIVSIPLGGSDARFSDIRKPMTLPVALSLATSNNPSLTAFLQ